MKPISKMTQPEIGAYIVTHLAKVGIPVVLSGGAVVSIYSDAGYVSKDLDLVDIYFHQFKRIREAMTLFGFTEQGRYFKHPESEFFVEFPPGPLSVGAEPIREIVNINYPTGILTLISPTECIKDRLAAYYHWNDQQCLEQAILVAAHQDIDLVEVRRWSTQEGKLVEFEAIESQLLNSFR